NVIDNDSQKIEPISVEQNQNQVEKKGFEIKGFKVEVNTGVVNDLKKTVKDFMKNSKLVTWDDYKGGIEEVTEKISQPNADLIR
ncbi:MAG TPA: hypothetical protein VHX42_01915, partial [Candidatus Babeliales bacterium]|nr:hypothetical protein [Candidatus Babeliales bacterium]